MKSLDNQRNGVYPTLDDVHNRLQVLPICNSRNCLADQGFEDKLPHRRHSKHLLAVLSHRPLLVAIAVPTYHVDVRVLQEWLLPKCID